MNKDARRLRDNYGIAYTTALRLIREQGLEAAIDFCAKIRGREDESPAAPPTKESGLLMATETPAQLYPELDPLDLEPQYSAHVSAMTAEGLHAKSAIAQQLAWRDQTIARLELELARKTMAKMRAPVHLENIVRRGGL